MGQAVGRRSFTCDRANLSSDPIQEFAFRAPACTWRCAGEPKLAAVRSAPGQFVLQLQGQPGVRYYLQDSTNLLNWLTFSTNTLTCSGTLNITNSSAGNASFYRALWSP
jgi:hypothetical protein